jgi:hypothetical protein
MPFAGSIARFNQLGNNPPYAGRHWGYGACRRRYRRWGGISGLIANLPSKHCVSLRHLQHVATGHCTQLLQTARLVWRGRRGVRIVGVRRRNRGQVASECLLGLECPNSFGDSSRISVSCNNLHSRRDWLMGLTLDKEQKLEAVNLIKFFDKNRKAWISVAGKTFEFIKGNFPEGSEVRPDDISKPLLAIVEVDKSLRDQLNEKRLTQKYWISHFTDLVIERAWPEISKSKGKP